MGESVYLSLPINSAGSVGLQTTSAGRSLPNSYGREKVSSAYGMYGPNSLPEFDLVGIIVVARDVYGREMAGIIVVAVPRDDYPSEIAPTEIYDPTPQKSPRTDTRVAFDGFVPNERVSDEVQSYLDTLPLEQRQSVKRAVISDMDGPGGIMGAYAPYRRGEILVDGSDINSGLAKTVAHESFHALTCQKLLKPFERYATTGISDQKGYGKSVKDLWDIYAQAQRKRNMRAFPTDYSRSCAYAVYRARSYEEAEQAASVGFMEYLAELASELQTKGHAVKNNASPQLRQSYEVMERILRNADSNPQVYA
ncbi:MAG: hypothetical protein WC527_01320 [Candidatus Margulisiibacteriota bacterium]